MGLYLHQVLRRKLNGGTNSSQHAFIVGNVFACNVEGSTVVNRCADNAAFQANRDVHPFFNAHHLDWGMALVMVAGYDNIEVTPACAEEECVRRKGTNDVNAFLLRALNAGLQLLFFFPVAEQAVFSGMRINPANCDARILKACFFNVS